MNTEESVQKSKPKKKKAKAKVTKTWSVRSTKGLEMSIKAAAKKAGMSKNEWVCANLLALVTPVKP